MALLEQYVPANRFAFYSFNAAVALFAMDNTAINTMTTWAGTDATTSMQGWIMAQTVTERNVHLQRQIANNLATVVNLGISTNAALGTADTVTNARNLFIGNDSNLSGAAYPSFAWPV